MVNNVQSQRKLNMHSVADLSDLDLLKKIWNHVQYFEFQFTAVYCLFADFYLYF